MCRGMYQFDLTEGSPWWDGDEEGLRDEVLLGAVTETRRFLATPGENDNGQTGNGND